MGGLSAQLFIWMLRWDAVIWIESTLSVSFIGLFEHGYWRLTSHGLSRIFAQSRQVGKQQFRPQSRRRSTRCRPARSASSGACRPSCQAPGDSATGWAASMAASSPQASTLEPHWCDLVPKEKSMGKLSRVVQQKRERAQQVVTRIDAAIAALGSWQSIGKGVRRTISAAGRKAISLAQKARWAKKKSNDPDTHVLEHVVRMATRRRCYPSSQKRMRRRGNCRVYFPDKTLPVPPSNAVPYRFLPT